MADETHPVTQTTDARARHASAGRGMRIIMALTLSIGTLVLVAVLSVLGITLLVARQNTLDLLQDKGQLLVFSLEQRIEAILQPAENQLAYVAGRMTAKNGSKIDRDRTIDLLTGALSATPQIATIVFVDANRNVTAVQRDGSLVYQDSLSNDRQTVEILDLAEKDRKPAWRQVIWRPPFGTPLVNFHYPVHGDTGFMGVLVALIPAVELSKMLTLNDSIMAAMDSDGADVVAGSFILSGRDHVLAHPAIKRDEPGLSPERPLPAVANFKDPILAGIWRDWSQGSETPTDHLGISGHVTQTDDTRYIFVYRELIGYGHKPWFVGTYIRMTDAFDELIRLALAGGVGLVILIIAILVTIYLGRKIARPVQRLAVAADRVRDLNLAAVSELPGSRIRELNDAAAAFNSMVNGLRWFENYVPRTLVRRLLGRGTDATASQERQVTVMFTDIAGFTPLSEGMPAPELAGYLNHHFAIVAGCIEREGGTVDKFIGDAVMAFWGAPEDQPDHADRACRAALAIRETLQSDNAALERDGKPPVHIRVGIHTGPVVVGNIGSPERVNYTIVGDTVNVGQRLEGLGKEMARQDEVCSILVSGDTRAAMTSDLSPDFVGEREVKGRDEPVPVFRI